MGPKQPPSILKNSTYEKSNKDYINEFQQKEDRGQAIENSKLIIISDDEDDVPKKLEANERNRQKLKAAAVNPNCPEGHVLLSEEERLETLKLATKRMLLTYFPNITSEKFFPGFKMLVDDLNHLPMTAETLRVRNRKISIEKELRELEKNIRIFSRTKVYVKLD